MISTVDKLPTIHGPVLGVHGKGSKRWQGYQE